MISFSRPRPTPEERAADREERNESRTAINNARTTIHALLSNLKDAAPEDHDAMRKLYQNVLDWLKANPTVLAPDIEDYFSNNVSVSPLYQSILIRKNVSDVFKMFKTQTEARIKYLTDKRPELLDMANDLLAPMNAYRDTLYTWFKNAQLTLLPQDYEDKISEVKEAVVGSDGKGDIFDGATFIDDAKLQKKVIEKQAEDSQINIQRLISKIVSITITFLSIALVGWGAFLGASYSTNLNIYRSFWYRVFYAFYGALFCFIVVPYEIIYKKWWLKIQLPLYGYIPLFEAPEEKWSWIGKHIFFFFEKTPTVVMYA
jgi:hypothetical protein